MSFDPTTRTALSPAELAHTDHDAALMRHHHMQKQINQDIVAHVAVYGPCGFIELSDLFGAFPNDGKQATERFRQRLNYLSCSGQLHATGNAGARRWRAPLQDAQPCLAPAEPLPAWVGTAALPARNDCMHGPTYVPDRSTALRPGCQDFKHLASRGDRC